LGAIRVMLTEEEWEQEGGNYQRQGMASGWFGNGVGVGSKRKLQFCPCRLLGLKMPDSLQKRWAGLGS